MTTKSLPTANPNSNDKMSKSNLLKKPKTHPRRLLQLSDLQEHNAFFDAIVDMIPSKLYIAGHSGDDYNPKYHKGQHKENREARRAQNKRAKLAKFDPELAEGTVQAKKRLEAEDGGAVNSVLPQKHQGAAATNKSQSNQKDNVNHDKGDTPKANGQQDNQSRIEALRAKLHAKIAEKGGNRPSDPSAVSKRAARRAEKQRRKEEALKRKKGAQTKVNNSQKSQTYTLPSQGGAAGQVVDPAQDLATMDFGRLAGLNSTSPHYKNNKALANLNKGKNLEKILADAEEKRQKLEALKRSNLDEDKEKLLKIQWGDALKEASGERIKDDPAKLKQKLKRKAAKKTKSTKAWKSRMEQTQQKMDDRQNIRKHNLDQRKVGGKAGSSLSKKRIVAADDEKKKEGRRLSRPGFEGRKQGFINDVKQQ